MKIKLRKQLSVNELIKWLTKFFTSSFKIDLSEYKIDENNWGVVLSEQLPLLISIDTTNDDFPIFVLNSKICEIPLSNILPFYRKCLELNTLFQGAAIFLNDSCVYFSQKIPVGYLYSEELSMYLNYQLNSSKSLYESLFEEFEITNEDL